MTAEELVRLVVSFLGGGVAAALIVWLKEVRSAKAQRRLDRIRAQIENLYGPLYFFSSQNVALFELANEILRAYGAEFVGKKWSQSEHTQANLKQDATATIELANTYVSTAVSNNNEMVKLLRFGYAYIDVDDEDVFREFILDQERLKREFLGEGPMKTPFAIYQRIGEISYMRPGFADRVRSKFRDKKSQAGEVGRGQRGLSLSRPLGRRVH